MPLVLNTSAPIASWFTPESLADEPEAPRFQLRPLTQQQFYEVNFLHGAIGGGMKFTPDQVALLLQYGLTDWQNVVDQNGKPLKMNRATLQHLPMDLRVELAAEIFSRSELKEDDAKN